MLGINRSAAPDVLAYPVGWFSPSYKMLLEVWRECVRIFAPITLRSNVQDRRIEFVTGGLLEFWSLDNPDVARGRKYKRAIIDEAAMIPMLLSVFHHVIRPALADYQGDAWFLSTPKGMNDFKTIFDWGNDPLRPEWASWQMPTSFNPFIADSEIEAMRQEMPARTYNQEVLAIFTENEGAVFRNIPACLHAPQTRPDQHEGHTLYAGVDWGKQNDFTAVSVGCADCRIEVALDRFNQIDYAFQHGRLAALVDKWNVTGILPERNSAGEPIIEQLERAGLPIMPGPDSKAGFMTTASTKPPLIENMALTMERTEFQFQSIPVATAELEAYERKVSTVTGRSTYSAPEGGHDDTVMARALLLWALNQPQGAAMRQAQVRGRKQGNIRQLTTRRTS
jgi:hypothetical protein